MRSVIDTDLENACSWLRIPHPAILSLRKSNIKVRQPLQKVFIPAPDSAMAERASTSSEGYHQG